MAMAEHVQETVSIHPAFHVVAIMPPILAWISGLSPVFLALSGFGAFVYYMSVTYWLWRNNLRNEKERRGRRPEAVEFDRATSAAEVKYKRAVSDAETARSAEGEAAQALYDKKSS